MASTPPARSLPDGYRIETLTPADTRDILTLDTWAFPSAIEVDELEKMPLPFTWSRVVGVVADVPDHEAVPIDGARPSRSELVGMHASYPFAHFPVPGSTVPAAGLTWVGVHPGHRRRGVLRAMIDHHFARCRERGESVSVLTAAEMAIYGRFGYGLAALDVRMKIPRGAQLRDVAGAERHTVRIEQATQERHGDLVAHLHRRAGEDPTGHGGAINRPGWATRETPELETAFWADPVAFRKGKEARRIAIVELDGEPRGYATFRRTLSWEDTGPRGTVDTGEVVALDAAAARALWGVLLDFDLMSDTHPFVIPTDDAITHLLVDPRAATPRLGDNVWTRIVDVRAALAGRRYAADLDVVLQVTDDLLSENAGRWRLRATAFGEASCERTDDAPDITLDVRALGSAYLGGMTLASQATAGLVSEHTTGELARTSTAFGWPVAPAASWIF